MNTDGEAAQPLTLMVVLSPLFLPKQLVFEREKEEVVEEEEANTNSR